MIANLLIALLYMQISRLATINHIPKFVAKFCHCGGRTLPLRWESSPITVAMQCQTSGKVLPPQSENFPTATAVLSHRSQRTLAFC